MPANAGKRVRAAVELLQKDLSLRSTGDVTAAYLEFCLQRANDLRFNGGLVSPARQGDFLLSVLLSTTEPANPRPFGEREWKNAVRLLNEAFGAYQEIFYPTSEESAALSDEWKKIRHVAMPTFLHYFNTGLLASPDQVCRRIERYLVPFDSELKNQLGISASDALRIAEAISDSLQAGLNHFNELTEKLGVSQREIFNGGKTLAEARTFAVSNYPDHALELLAGFNNIGIIELRVLREKFGDLADRYWTVFSVARGEGPQIAYPTEAAVPSTHPLIRLSQERAAVPALNSLFTAILSLGESILDSSPQRDRFLVHRDKTLEEETALQFQRLVSSSAKIYPSVFERPDGHNEHDIVVLDNKVLFIIEAKASAPPEPFRDPDRAFTRIRRAFHSDRGIQKAFDQAASIRRRLDSGERVPLFDRKGDHVTDLIPEQIPVRYCVVVTRDDFGPLATDLALLLEKDPGEPYPWAINILDLESMADAWDHLKWGTRELTDYLKWRVLAHGKAFTTDELEMVGYHLQHGSLESVVTAAADYVGFNPHYSDFFDELYRHQRYGTAAPKLKTKPPVVMDLTASMRRGDAVFVDHAGNELPSQDRSRSERAGEQEKRPPGRNEPCLCGSGKKYKRCCGRRTQ